MENINVHEHKSIENGESIEKRHEKSTTGLAPAPATAPMARGSAVARLEERPRPSGALGDTMGKPWEKPSDWKVIGMDIMGKP